MIPETSGGWTAFKLAEAAGHRELANFLRRPPSTASTGGEAAPFGARAHRISTETKLEPPRLEYQVPPRYTQGALGRKVEDVKELVETVISDSWSFPDLRP